MKKEPIGFYIGCGLYLFMIIAIVLADMYDYIDNMELIFKEHQFIFYILSLWGLWGYTYIIVEKGLFRKNSTISFFCIFIIFLIGLIFGLEINIKILFMRHINVADIIVNTLSKVVVTLVIFLLFYYKKKNKNN